MNPQLHVQHDTISGFCHEHGIRRLAVFGSATRADFSADSDVDVVIDLKPETRVGLVAFQRMQEELASIFGRPVDLVTGAGLNRHIRDAVLQEAEILYAE